MRIRAETFTEADPTRALVILAFHSTGAAAPIAAAYLREQVDLPLVGHIMDPELGPVVHVADGVATSPVRILGGTTKCSLEDCERVYLVTAELPLPLPVIGDIAEAILDWAKDAALILCLDAVVRDGDDATPDVHAVAGDKEALEMLSSTAAKPLPAGVLVGMTGAMLLRARGKKARVAAVVVEAARSHPDGRAAAELVKILDPLLPDIDIDPGPLLAEAMKLEERIAKSIREAQEAQPQRPGHTFI